MSTTAATVGRVCHNYRPKPRGKGSAECLKPATREVIGYWSASKSRNTSEWVCTDCAERFLAAGFKVKP